MLTRIITKANSPTNSLKIYRTASKAFSTENSVDKKEVDFFSKLFDSWWDERSGPMKPLHTMNALRVPFIRDGILQQSVDKNRVLDKSQPLKAFKILDAGCGAGILTEPLARIGANITGVDASADLIEVAKAHMKLDSTLAPNLRYETASIEDHSENNPEVYDAVISSEVMEHVTNKELFLESCVKCLKPGGSIFITTLNKTYLAWLGGVCLVENIVGLLPKGTHDYNKFIKPHEVQRILEDNNCRTVIVHGMLYNIMTNNWSWSSVTSLNFALHAVKLNVKN